MGRIITILVLLLASVGLGYFGIKGLSKEHRVLASMQPATATITKARTIERRGSKGSKKYRLAAEFVAQPADGSGKLIASTLNADGDAQIRIGGRGTTDAWVARHPPGSTLPAYVSTNPDTGTRIAFLFARYEPEWALLLCMSVVAAGSAAFSAGSPRSTAHVVTRPAPGTEPPLLEVIPTYHIRAAALARTLAAIILLAGCAAIAVFYAFFAILPVEAPLWIAGTTSIVGVVFAVLAIKSILRAVRYRQPRVFVPAMPLTLGVPTVIVASGGTAHAPAQPMGLALRCEHVYTTGSGKSQQTKRDTVRTYLTTATPAATLGSTQTLDHAQHVAWPITPEADAPPSGPKPKKTPRHEWLVIVQQSASKGRELSMFFPVRLEQAD